MKAIVTIPEDTIERAGGRLAEIRKNVMWPGNIHRPRKVDS